MEKNKIQGEYGIELKFVDESRIYLNYWDWCHGEDICCQIKDGKIYKFTYTPAEVEADEVKDESEIDDVFKQEEISLTQFIELVQQVVLKRI